MTTEFGLGAVAKKKVAVKKPAPAAVAAVANDELIAGARLEWSVMLALSAFAFYATEQGEFEKRVDALRKLMSAELGLQSIQVKTVESKWLNSAYRNQLVIEMTTPINRRLKDDLRWDLEQLAKRAGLDADPNPAHNNLRIVSQGIAPTGQSAGAPAQRGTGDYNRNNIDPGNKPSGLDSFLTGLGISTPFAIAAAAFVGIILLRR
ncbi:MAG TPA: hypothetical protein PLD20_05805 [Blastocatellia bacterium]|nr:hypothetical protein [Blastocatellia bacterium]HMV87611.1 hypothetical protein [Blastocatellia bacterium]HMY74913.1 hypothetical protein [Blastocatellia bacterium]HMZ17422.1 hypothetical protein [Blastocatellia bacterium]HNG29206.1 hypothetical protein [Blastocatellia bacterium]